MWVTVGMIRNNRSGRAASRRKCSRALPDETAGTGAKPHYIIGVTGITGSGTSTVSAILAEHGGYVISADKLAREVMQHGQPAYDEIVREFGPSIVVSTAGGGLAPAAEPGEIDRKALGVIVFGNPEKLALLESIIHPAVIARVKEMLGCTSLLAKRSNLEVVHGLDCFGKNTLAMTGRSNQAVGANCIYPDAPFAIIDAPLLIESGLHKICHSVWLVTARDNVRLARIMQRDGIDTETATRRLNSRAGDDILRPHANVIIENNSDLTSLREQVERNLSFV